MSTARSSFDGDGIIPLVRETVEGLGRLVADHIKLARVEMVADAREYGRQVGLMILAGLLIAIGYGFAWLGAALLLARFIGAPLAFVAVAAAHLLAGVVGLLAMRGRLKKARVLNETVSTVSRSVSTIAAEVRSARVP
jgi:hypothetical protein